jgi:hypothetical protein
MDGSACRGDGDCMNFIRVEGHFFFLRSEKFYDIISRYIAKCHRTKFKNR